MYRRDSRTGSYEPKRQASSNSSSTSRGGYRPQRSSGRSDNRSFGGHSNINEGRSASRPENRSFGGYNSENRSSGGNFRRSFNSRSSSNSGGYRGNRGGGRRNFSRSRTTISYDRYIFKAEPIEAIAPYKSTKQFNDFDLENILKANIIKKGYFSPTQIQDVSIPEVLAGRDVVGLAGTGSGKTAAFLIPLINKVLRDNTQKVLIIVPTRELADQINEEFRDFTGRTDLKSAVVIGGKSITGQVFQLRKRPQFVIGTPGRLKDLMNRRELNLTVFNNIVLDEVDRMLDMGFVDEIKFLISKMSQNKQTLFFSATMTPEAKRVSDSLLQNPVFIEVESQKTSKYIDQDIIKVSSHEEKVDKLHDLLIQKEFEKVLIFSQTKRGVDKLYYELRERGFRVDAIHGDKSQFIRAKVIQKFRDKAINILVATDVAARGLDIPNVSHVINYDEPENYEDYIHRIGRTGRAGKSGKALTFVR